MLGLSRWGLAVGTADAVVTPVTLAAIRPTEAPRIPRETVRLRCAASADAHRHARGWDYSENRADPATGLRQAAIVEAVRGANRGQGSPRRRRRHASGHAARILRCAPVQLWSQFDDRCDEVRRSHTHRESDYDERNWNFVKPGTTH